jgi:Anti-sigma-K factor rskA
MAEHATLSCDEFLDLAAAIALDADADADELERVEEHARVCADCRAALDEFSETAAVLGAVVPQVEPAEELRSRVIEAARREPRPILRRLWPRLVRRRLRVSPVWAAMAASLFVSVLALGRVVVLQEQVSDLQRTAAAATDRAARFERLVGVLSSDNLAVRPLQPVVQTLPSRGMVYLDPASGTGMLMCHYLPPIAQGHAYQVWFVRGNERLSAGMLWPDATGNGYTVIQVPKDVQSFDSIGLTDEPGSGSAWPTTPRVIGGPVKESSQ